MNKKLYSFDDHPEHRARLPEWRDKWIAIALRTEPQTDEDRGIMTRSIVGLYRAANLEPPTTERIVFVPSPIQGAFAATTAACIWWLRENQDSHGELFGRKVTESELMAAVPLALGNACPAAEKTIQEVVRDNNRKAPKKDAKPDPEVLKKISEFYVESFDKWSNMADGGNQWAYWSSYISFFRHVAKLDLPIYEDWQHYEAAAIHGGPRFMHERFCIVSDFPTRICRDDQNRPHSQSGPSIAWSDGNGAYYWHGTNVPKEWIESPGTVDPQLALTHENIEQRRCLAEIIGWSKVLRLLNARVVDRDVDPMIGELVEVDLPEVGAARFLRVRCGTGREFAISVPLEVKTALRAQSWMHNDIGEDVIRNLQLRT